MGIKRISPDTHGIIDYAFASSLLSVPRILSMSKKARSLYFILGINVLLYSSLTRYRYSILPIIPLSNHRLFDIASVAVVAGTTLYTPRKRIKRINSRIFGLLLISIGVLAITLTDWDKKVDHY